MKRGYNTTLTTEQLNLEKENRNLGLKETAAILGVSIGTMSYNRWVIKQQEKPPVHKNYFDLDLYCRELVTI